MDEPPNLCFGFLMSSIGCGPTVTPQIAEQRALVQRREISWREYSDRVAKLVTDRSLYGELISYYQLQAAGWGLTFLAAVFG